MVEIIPNWHPIFVHFTIALLSLSVVFYLVAFIKQTSPLQTHWHTYARWNLWLGAGFSIATAIAGWFAYNSVTHDTPSHAAMTDHRNWALITISVFLVLAAWEFYRHRHSAKTSWIYFAVLLSGALLLASTGWRGGELVYRYGLGVMALPQAESHDHVAADHEHDSLHSNDTSGDQMHEHDSISNPESQDNNVSSKTSSHDDDGHNHSH